jgi:hypothetical protein
MQCASHDRSSGVVPFMRVNTSIIFFIVLSRCRCRTERNGAILSFTRITVADYFSGFLLDLDEIRALGHLTSRQGIQVASLRWRLTVADYFAGFLLDLGRNPGY